MDSLVGYGSDDDVETDRHGSNHSVETESGGGASGGGGARRRDDDTNYDDVKMDMSEESGGESEPELPPATAPAPAETAPRPPRRQRSGERRRRTPPPAPTPAPRPRALLGDRPTHEPPPRDRREHHATDAVSPRFVERSGRSRDRDRERDHRHSTREDRSRSRHRDRHGSERRGHSSSRGGAPSAERRTEPEYRPSSYKVNKKLEVMEKMGLQIKTPDGSMATARQLRQAAGDTQHHTGNAALPSYYNPCAVNTNKILDQVQKRKLLWSNKSKSESEEAAKWSGARFAQDSDGKQVSKFMRLMGIKDPSAVKGEPAASSADPVKKQEELFEAMQAQYEVARATTHTMRGVGLGFQRGQL